MQISLVHGWGVNHHIFDEFITWLPENWDISTPDVLGHGIATNKNFILDEAIDDLASYIHKPTILLGWSLGSLLVMSLAIRYPEKVCALILVSGFARYRPADDYPEGVHSQALIKMANLFKKDYEFYVRQFIELQLMHTPERRFIMNQICPSITQYGCPPTIETALANINQADIRSLLPHIQCPCLVLCGDKDTVTPLSMSIYLTKHLPHAYLHTISKAAHAPFLSHAQECASVLTQFIARHQLNSYNSSYPPTICRD